MIENFSLGDEWCTEVGLNFKVFWKNSVGALNEQTHCTSKRYVMTQYQPSTLYTDPMNSLTVYEVATLAVNEIIWSETQVVGLNHLRTDGEPFLLDVSIVELQVPKVT